MKTIDHIKVPEPIYWSQGMLLSPQHFQQQELHLDKLITHKLYISQPYYWGLLDIDLSGSDLASGKVCLGKLHALLPDGEIIDYAADDYENPLETELGSIPYDENGDNLITVSIGVVRRAAVARTNNFDDRYEPLDFLDVVDENNADQIIDLRKKRLKLKFVTDKKEAPYYTTIPLFCLQMNKDKTFAMTSYHPPMLDINVGKKIFTDNNGVFSVAAKLENLINRMREKAMQLIGRESSDPADRQTVQALLGRLFNLEKLLKSSRAHPFQVYLGFIEMVTTYMLNADQLRVEDFRFVDYRHEDFAPGFLMHLDRMTASVEKIKLNYEIHDFDNRQNGVFELMLPEDVNPDEFIIDLVPRKGQGISDLFKWIAASRIGTLDVFDRLKEQRIAGAKRGKPNAEQKTSLPEKSTVVVLKDSPYSGESGKYASMSPGQVLRIQGGADDAPVAIRWFRKIDANHQNTAG